MEFSRCALRREAGPEAGLSKLNSVRTSYIEVNVFLGDSSDRTTEVIRRVESPRNSVEFRIP